MRFVVLFLSIFALASSAVALKDAICGLPPSEAGICYASHIRYSYVADSKECVEFHYGGCGGNENNFLSKEECEAKCKE
uniref:BPTI/Kunitz inhibitor domain-containing protein n=1 Tax=Stomoxys calcitrans TaxID=35570 RepID=A0A1I8NU35_STOCA